MSVPAGYKATEVGVIPEDWDVRRIVDVVSITTGSRNTQDRVPDGKYPFFVRSQTVERINSYSFDGEAVLTAGDGVGTGKIFHYVNGKFDCHQRVYRMSHFDGVNGVYFFKVFSGHFYDRIMAMTAKSSVDSVRREMIADMMIPLPSLPEQVAIAEALSDADEAVAAVEAVIAKKRALKTATMQALLSGTRRLPGFSGEWEAVDLGAIAHIKTGSRNNEDKQPDGKYPLFVRSQHVERIETYSYDEEAILVPGEGGVGSIFHYINGKFDCHQRVYKISRFAPEMSGRFVYFSMVHGFGSHAMQNTVKATVDSLRLPTFKAFRFLAPSRKEQDAIAQLILDLDDELADQVAKLVKLRRLKAGMMQQLLTGKIRLV